MPNFALERGPITEFGYAISSLRSGIVLGSAARSVGYAFAKAPCRLSVTFDTFTRTFVHLWARSASDIP